MDSERSSAPPERKRAASRYSVWVGIAFLILIVIATVNTLRTRDDGILGATATAAGEPLPEFAVPDLLGSNEGDANIYQDDCGTGANPCPEDDGRTPACEVDLPDVIRVCDLFDRPLVISFWFTRGADCLPTQDLIDDVSRRYAGRVNFLSVNVHDDHDEAAEIAREHDWRIRVGWDADGAVSNLYRVGGCPTVAFAYPGGLLREAVIGTDSLTEAGLTDDIGALLRASAQRAERSR